MPNAKVLSEKHRLKQPIVELWPNVSRAPRPAFWSTIKGITVAEGTALRTELRKDEVNYTVVKNTLTRKALDKLGMNELDHVLNGTTSWHHRRRIPSLRSASWPTTAKAG